MSTPEENMITEEENGNGGSKGLCSCCGWQGCCSFPHGKITAFALMGAIVTWFLLGMGVGGCDYVRVDGEPFVQDFYHGHHRLFVPKHEYGMGPYMRQAITIQNKTSLNHTDFAPRCVQWTKRDREFLDDAWKSSMGFAVIATICISLGSYVLCAMSCCSNPCGMSCWDIQYTKAGICFMFGFASMNQLLSFCAFSSEILDKYNGRASIGAYITILSMFVSFAVAVLIRPQRNEKVLESFGGDATVNVDNELAMTPNTNDNDITVETLPDTNDENARSYA